MQAAAREREQLPAGPSREEEAIQIAERLAALVESRRAASAAGAAPVPAAAPVAGARHSGRLLGNLLLTRGFLVESELTYALARQAETGTPLGQILVDLRLITDRDLVELLAEQMRMQVTDLRRATPDRALLSLLGADAARRLAAVPRRRVDGQIEVAVADPTDDAALGELTRLLGAPLRLLLASRADIEAAVDRLYS